MQLACMHLIIHWHMCYFIYIANIAWNSKNRQVCAHWVQMQIASLREMTTKLPVVMETTSVFPPLAAQRLEQFVLSIAVLCTV